MRRARQAVSAVGLLLLLVAALTPNPPIEA